MEVVETGLYYARVWAHVARLDSSRLERGTTSFVLLYGRRPI